MIKIGWDKRFLIGHERIDHEHQVFADLIRSTSIEAEKGAEREKLGRLLTEVKLYALFHFCSEENCMLDAGYPDYLQHKEEHKVLITQLEDLLQQFELGMINAKKIAEFLFEWFAFHTTKRDLEFAKFLNK